MKRRRFIKSLSTLPLLPAVARFVDPLAVTAQPQVRKLNEKTSPLKIGGTKQLFIDDQLIAASTHVDLVMNPPVKTGEANLIAEHPWESFYAGGWNTIIEDEGIYKMWYDAASISDSLSARKRDGRFVCYATSNDGINWKKPLLGLVEFEASKNNNILMRDTTGAVFLDPNNNGGERFKYVGWWDSEKRGINQTEVWLFSSPDGLRWKPFGGRPIMAAKGQYDTQNQIFWDDRVGKYVAYVRNNIRGEKNGERYTIRQTHRAESDTLTQWPQHSLVFSPDNKDPFVSDHYNICAIKYPYAPGVYFGFPSPYLHTNVANRNDGPLDIQLITSRDGITWNRLDRRPYVRLGVKDSNDCGSIYMSVGMLRKGNEIWMYSTGYDFTHGGYDLKTTRHKGVVSRLVQRLDGFVSADAAYTGGELRTIPVRFTGNTLVLNVDTGAMGSLRVEILDQHGKPIPGYSEKDCDMVNGNYINRLITWNGGSELGALTQQPVQLRFVMRSTKLYSFQFLPRGS